MNRLAKETSPYLRQHSDNPVDWFPWGQEALDLARRENRPILLSVGYSACHWCHVMAHESFEDSEMAALMNRWFVNVKLDREERPDLDQLYQGVVQLMGRGGGWPLTVFLTPDLRPFFGGTYFPPQDRYGMPSFRHVLTALHEAWENQRAEVEQQADEIKSGLLHLTRHGLETAPGDVSGEDVVAAARNLAEEIDPQNGGFGGAPKFPNPMNVALLFRGFRRGGGDALRDAGLLTLRRMAQGGIYDQLGGGFHRYSVDARWLVPHFEKMLYDNGQLLHLYAEAEQIQPDLLWREVVEETIRYLEREMTSPEGGFYATQDADSEGEEGKFFTWTPAEVREALEPSSAEMLMRHLSVPEGGNFEHGRSVLEVVHPPADGMARAALAGARSKLREVRDRRVKPGRDDKVLAGWNGLAIRGIAFASHVFASPEWAQLATRAADCVLARLWDGKRLRRVYQDGAVKPIDGFLEDYGQLAAGLTTLYQAAFEPRFLEAALGLVDVAQSLFWDEVAQAYQTAPHGQADLLVAPFALHDNAVPSGASSLTEAQVALAALTGRSDLLDRASRYVRRLEGSLKRNPFAWGHLWLAADALADGAAELVVVGRQSELRDFIEPLRKAYTPTVTRLFHDPERSLPEVVRASLEGKKPANGTATAYLCRHFACESPVSSVAALQARLEESGLSPPQPPSAGR